MDIHDSTRSTLQDEGVECFDSFMDIEELLRRYVRERARTLPCQYLKTILRFSFPVCHSKDVRVRAVCHQRLIYFFDWVTAFRTDHGRCPDPLEDFTEETWQECKTNWHSRISVKHEDHRLMASILPAFV